MSSGEADAAYHTAHAMRSLDAFRKCSIEGCQVMVHLSGDGRCKAHGATRDGIPEYLTDTDSGAFIYVRHVSLDLGSDCE